MIRRPLRARAIVPVALMQDASDGSLPTLTYSPGPGEGFSSGILGR